MWNVPLCAAVVGIALVAPLAAAPPTLESATGELQFVQDDHATYGLRLVVEGVTLAETLVPVVIDVVPKPGVAPLRLNTRYVDLETRGNTVTASTSLTTLNKTRFDIVDRWSVDADSALRLNREVRIVSARNEVAFASRLEWRLTSPGTLHELDVFIPGLWYSAATHTPMSGLITDIGQQDFLLREDRMPLPLLSARDKSTGWTITLAHVDPDGTTIRGDDTLERVVDERLRFGSLGIRRVHDSLSLAFVYPGSEGEQTSIFGYKPELRTVERFHPIRAGASHDYRLTIRATRAASFPDQLRAAWRAGWNTAQPRIVSSDLQRSYEASIGVLEHYWYERGEIAGFPFSASLPDGAVKDPSLQMGFVGQQLPCASYLIDEGIRSRRDDLVRKGEKVVDFWTKNCFNERGVPRTWYDLEPTPHWRDYNTFLRVVTDGTSGVLRAWQVERSAGRDKPQWLAFARRVGDWLTTIQNADGSFFREWKFDGEPASQSKTSTLHPVRLLVDLSCATGEARYRTAALRAAGFAIKANTSGALYVGGTPDNPDVLDKEAGWIAMDSYLALYDVTRDPRWLDAAADAAAFTGTWIYGWSVPLPLDREEVGVPRVKTFAGTNLIATGHSGADNFLSFASFSYARLWIYTGDEHWLDVATILQHNSAQFVDTGSDGNALGYAVPGLQVEAFSLAVNRGHSVRVWLPWLTSATLEPMVRMREALGVIDVESLRETGRAGLVERHAAWARHRGMD